MMKKMLLVAVVGLLAIIGQGRAWAGPPFFTDDPEPVGYSHWEVYIASQWTRDRDDSETGTLPHVEIDYGAAPDVQLHMLAPMVYHSESGSSAQYGLGDLEFGAKYRFIHEEEKGLTPQVGTYPMIDLPTHSQPGLGEPNASVFIPVWVQKSWGPWTTYGGGGYRIHPGEDNKNFWYTGWVLQKDLSETVTLGAEIFNFSPRFKGESDETGFNVGGYFNLSDMHHVLFSAGQDLKGPNDLFAYVAYQLTFGPGQKVTFFPEPQMMRQ